MTVCEIRSLKFSEFNKIICGQFNLKECPKCSKSKDVLDVRKFADVAENELFEIPRSLFISHRSSTRFINFIY